MHTKFNNLKIFSVILLSIFLLNFIAAGTMMCDSRFENIRIETKSQFAINEEIGDINISVKSNLDQDLNYRVRIFEDTNKTNVSLEEWVNSEEVLEGRLNAGKAEIVSIYEPITTKNLQIVVDVCTEKTKRAYERECPSGMLKTEIKKISIKQDYELNFRCPITNYMGEQTKCTWAPYDNLNKKAISINPPIITITQGSTVINGNQLADSITFTPIAEGDMKIDVTVSALGYVDKQDTITVKVTSTGNVATLKIDNTNTASITEAGVKTGARKLTFEVKKGTKIIPLRNINAKLITPTGEEKTVTFVKLSSGAWEATVNLDEAGQTYLFEATLIPLDSTENSIPFTYDILTLSSATPKDEWNTTMIIIAISIIVVIMIGTALVIFFLTRKKKRR